MSTVWTVHLTATADAEFVSILERTERQFGKAQAMAYEEALTAAIAALAAGPNVAGTKLRDSVLGLRTLHIARRRRKGRHFLLFRIGGSATRSIEVLRILHDAMDLSRHFPVEDAPGES